MRQYASMSFCILPRHSWWCKILCINRTYQYIAQPCFSTCSDLLKLHSRFQQLAAGNIDPRNANAQHPQESSLAQVLQRSGTHLRTQTHSNLTRVYTHTSGVGWGANNLHHGHTGSTHSPCLGLERSSTHAHTGTAHSSCLGVGLGLGWGGVSKVERHDNVWSKTGELLRARMSHKRECTDELKKNVWTNKALTFNESDCISKQILKPLKTSWLQNARHLGKHDHYLPPCIVKWKQLVCLEGWHGWWFCASRISFGGPVVLWFHFLYFNPHRPSYRQISPFW